MYAVLKGKEIVYMGDDSTIAVSKFQLHEKDAIPAQLVQVKDLQELLVILSPKAEMPAGPAPKQEDDVFSEAAKALFETLDELGLNSDTTDRVVSDIKKNIAEVRSLGIDAMKAVGDGFVAFGDLLRKTGEEIDK